MKIIGQVQYKENKDRFLESINLKDNHLISILDTMGKLPHLLVTEVPKENKEKIWMGTMFSTFTFNNDSDVDFLESFNEMVTFTKSDEPIILVCDLTKGYFMSQFKFLIISKSDKGHSYLKEEYTRFVREKRLGKLLS